MDKEVEGKWFSKDILCFHRCSIEKRRCSQIGSTCKFSCEVSEIMMDRPSEGNRSCWLMSLFLFYRIRCGEAKAWLNRWSLSSRFSLRILSVEQHVWRRPRRHLIEWNPAVSKYGHTGISKRQILQCLHTSSYSMLFKNSMSSCDYAPVDNCIAF